MKPLVTTLFTVLLAVISFEAASECSEKTIELIKSSSKAWGRDIPGSAGGGIKDKAIAFVEFALRDNPDIRDRNIALMRACTDSDLASITPKAKASQSGSAASNCGRSISWTATDVVKYPPSATTYNHSWELISENPVKLRYTINGESHERKVEALIAEAELALKHDQDNPHCNQIQYCREDKIGQEKTLAWLRCLASNKGNSVTANSGSPSKEAEQIPNCPPTLPPSCVTWSQYDQQLQWWNLTNNCGRDVSVTFRSEGALENTQTFGNGESYRAKWRGANPPKQIVWDAAKGFGFYRNKPAGAALKCQSSLPL